MPSNSEAVSETADRQRVPDPVARNELSSIPDEFLIVAIGASAGGLEACTAFLTAMSTAPGMAFILVQHLDPTHDSMLVDLLSAHTPLPVVEVTDGMSVECDHLYVIPPGATLSVDQEVLQLSPPPARHGVRLPFDILLRSLARNYGSRVVCVILSGSGADGSLGLRAVKEHGGLVVAQEPEEAHYDGMPRSAILTGAVDLVLPVAEIPSALSRYERRAALIRRHDSPSLGSASDAFVAIIELLRTRTPHDFTTYKRGTLQRRIERRMALAMIDIDDMAHYLDALRADAGEVDLLAKDLLVNVTAFFRDGPVFDLLAGTVVPDLIRAAEPGGALRVWVAGCSSGEEAYSLAMLFLEEIAANRRDLRLQVIASDVDPDTVATAREGFYPDQAAAAVSPARLARFFTREDHGHRVALELRAAVVFTVHNVLSDPPFSRLDLVSCRNLLIYLGPEAQAKVVSLFHFALREGGVLLLGGAESVNGADARFEVMMEPERVYRHIDRSRPGDLGFSVGVDVAFNPQRAAPQPTPASTLSDLCHKVVLEDYAPAAVLIDRRRAVLFTMGPTDRYLRVAPGHATHDLAAMLPREVRTRLISALRKAGDQQGRAVVSGVRLDRTGSVPSFKVVARPVLDDDRGLMLVCFVDEPTERPRETGRSEAADTRPVADIDSVRTELQDALRELEMVGERQRTVEAETLSVTQEYQVTNEELLTSKEELQSLNEELTALNSQLQETLTRQRTTADDLQNVLYSTDVATLFLDNDLRIRFFTPSTKALFSVIATDIGRPLADLSSLASDDALLADSRSILTGEAAIEREILGHDGAWFTRRILPYRTRNGEIEGVVITYADITERRHTADALVAAERQAHMANAAKTRFLAAASHDLRQPLQTLTLLQGLLADAVVGGYAIDLVARLDRTLNSMSGILNTLLDINQIEAGMVRAEPVDFRIDGLLGRLRDEFAFTADKQGLELRVVRCGLSVRSDPRLLEQMLRNLLSNAFKYTRRGKVLFGCRRRRNLVSVEVWDTGIGIPSAELNSIFEEYRQLANPAREAAHGLGLGLSIVQRLSGLLGHGVRVRSNRGKGSVFSIDIALPLVETRQRDPDRAVTVDVAVASDRQGSVLIVEDEAEVCGLLEMTLQREGHRIATAQDARSALALVRGGRFRPDLVLADYNLPGDMDGLALAAKLRAESQYNLPVVILTGDISADTLRAVAGASCLYLDKPVKPVNLVRSVQGLLSRPPPLPPSDPAHSATTAGSRARVFVVDDDRQLRDALRVVLESGDIDVEEYGDAEAFLEAYRPSRDGCVLIDATLPGISGLDLLARLRASDHAPPAIVITGHSDVAMAVAAMKAGASDFIEKPIAGPDLLASIERALEGARDATALSARHAAAASQVAGLTLRQREIMSRVLDGQPSKNIAADLGISQRTVENHRANIMQKTGSKSLPALARMALIAGLVPVE